MLSPRTGLGLEAKKTGLGLDGNGLSLETLRPRPHVVWPRGLVYCNVFISCSVPTATVQSVIMKTKDGNVVNEARSGQGREKIGKPCPAIPVLYHTALVTVSVIKLRIYIVNRLWPRLRSTRPRPHSTWPWPLPRILLASLTSLTVT